MKLTVEIHLNYSTDKTLRVFGHNPCGRKPELDFLDGLSVRQHNDHLELDYSLLPCILERLLKSGEPYIITGH